MDAGDAYRRLAPSVLAYLRGQRVPEPEDLLGEVFVQVARSLPRFRGTSDEDLRRWVFTIARNRVIDDARKRKRRPSITTTDTTPDRAGSPAEDGLDRDLLEALARLTPEQRDVVTLRFVADLSLDDVARITGQTTGAVKAMQSRALAQLARILDDPSSAE